MLRWRVRQFFKQLFWTKKEKEFYGIFGFSAQIQRTARKQGYIDLDYMVKRWKLLLAERTAHDAEMKRQYDEICKHGLTKDTPLEPLLWHIGHNPDIERKLVKIKGKNGVEKTVETVRWKPFSCKETDGDAEE